jgi:hypothetical protein
VTVRLAQPADEPALFSLLMAVHREGLGRVFPYDPEKVNAAIQHGTRQRGGIIGVIDAPDKPGTLAGSVGLDIQEWWWSRDCFMQERWLYVFPAYRHGTGYFAALKQFAEDCRASIDRDKRQASPFVLEASFVNGDPRRVRVLDKLWARWGRRIGGIYLSGL